MRIGTDQPRRVTRRMHRHDDAVAERAIEQVGHAGDERDRLDRFRTQRLLSRECEQLAGQRGGAVGTVGGIVDMATGGDGIVGDLPSGEFEPAENHRQHIVEIVRDATGELPHRVHFLHLPQLAFLREQHFGRACDGGFEFGRAVAFGLRLGAGDGAFAQGADGQPPQRDPAEHEQHAEDRQGARDRGRACDRLHSA